MPKKLSDNKDFDFSASLAQLESIIRELENGSINLADAVARFEQGAQLAKDLKEYLNNTELTINKIKLSLDK